MEIMQFSRFTPSANGSIVQIEGKKRKIPPSLCVAEQCMTHLIERSLRMEKTDNSKFMMFAWLVMLVAYVVAVGLSGVADRVPFAICGAFGAIGLAQSWANLIDREKKNRA